MILTGILFIVFKFQEFFNGTVIFTTNKLRQKQNDISLLIINHTLRESICHQTGCKLQLTILGILVKCFLLRFRKGIRIGPSRVREPPTEAKNRKKHHLKLFSVILDPALNQKVHLILNFLT